MEKSFDQKWGSKLLIGMMAVTVAYALFQLSPTSSAAKDDDSFFERYYQEITDELYAETGAPANLSWDSVFGKSGPKNGQNLYILVYEEAKRGPATTALDTTAKYYGYTKDEMQQILDGYIDVIEDYNEATAEYSWVGVSLHSIDSVLYMQRLIEDYYNEQLQLEETRNELNSTAFANEMFVNDDTSDSGYDLISDLKIIETILFYGANNGGYGSGGGDLPDFPDGGDGGGSGSGSGSGDDDDDDDESERDLELEESELAVEEGAEEDATSEEDSEEAATGDECFEDDALANALDNFLDSDDYVETHGDIDGGGGDGDGSGGGDDGSGDGSGSGDSGGSGGGVTSSLEAPEAANWDRGLPCNDFFCLEINFVNDEDEGDTEYEEYYNCIDCHFTYISETLDEVTSHDLAGGKVSGNMMEDATCKDDGLKVIPNLNVFAIASPILTPPNDDIVNVGSDLGGKFIEAIYPNYESADDDNLEETVQKAAISERLTSADKFTSYVQSVQGDQMSAIQIAETAQELIYKDYSTRLKEMEQIALSSQMNDMTTMFTTLDYEMDQMLSYFNSILISLNSNIEVLETILQKEYKDG